MSTLAQKVAVLFGGQTYAQKVAALFGSSLIGYWKMAEASGSVSVDSSPQANNGAYTAVTLGAAGIGDGLTAGSFDDATSFNNIYSAGLDADFNGAEGTLAIWAKVSGAGVWTDAALRFLAGIRVDGSNNLHIRSSGDTSLLYYRISGGTADSVTVASGSTVNYFHAALTWSTAADELKAYLNGVQAGATQTGLGAWAGALLSTGNVIGAQTTTPGLVWSGALAHALLLNRAATAAEVAQMYRVP